MKYPRGRHPDGKNLYVIIARPGVGSFMYRSNKYREGLGGIDVRTLAEAREMAAAIRKREHEGRDLRQEREDAKLRKTTNKTANEQGKTFREVADEFVKLKYTDAQPATIKRTQISLQKFILPKIGDMLTGQITQNDILKEHGIGLEKLWFKTPYAERIRALVERILNFAEYRDYPVHLHKGKNAAAWKGGLENILKPIGKLHKEKHRATFPSYLDVPRFLIALRGYKCRNLNPKQNIALPLLIELFLLTAVRENEGREARWGEFDLERMVWTIPSGPDGHTKRKDERDTPREIPITTHLLDLLKRAEKKCIEMGIDPSDPNALVFPGVGGRPIHAGGCTDFLERTLKWPTKITVHGFRSTLRAWCAENGYDDFLWNVQVDHTDGDKVSQAYPRGVVFKKRRDMLEAWGEFCTRPTPAAGTNVTPINQARKRRRAS
jgi:integrase